MFKPKYSLTPKLLSNVAQIERLYGQLEGLKIPQKLELNLERDNLIQSSYVSNSIEGNPLSLPEVTNLLLNDRVPVNRDEKEVVNYFNLLKQLENLTGQNISLLQIRELHKRLLAGVNNKIAGNIRNKKVIIGKYIQNQSGATLEIKHNPPFYLQFQIEKEIENLSNWVNEEENTPLIIKSGIFHHEFVYIHPFEDGNGRICRLLTALILLKNDYLINKYFVLDDYYDIERHLYSDKLHSADSGDKTEWLEYFSDGVKYSLQSALSKYEQALQTLKIEDRPSNKEKEVLKILQERREATSSDIVTILNITRQQAHSLLSALVDKGLLGKKGSTKSSYYYLK